MARSSSPGRGDALALVMVGLPARGKTDTARRVRRYLRWLGYRTEVFNVGNTRRALFGSRQSHEFFDPGNEDAFASRAEAARRCLDDMLAFFAAGGEVGIYDATNTTRERRAWVAARLRAHGLSVVFLESVCQDESIIENNIRQTKLHMPDYEGTDPDAAVRDFRQRIAHYESVYESVEEDEGSFVRIIDVGRRIELHRIAGYVPSRLVSFLMNLHLVPRVLWLSRHGESTFNVEDRVGGDPELSPRGREYAKRLAAFVRGQKLVEDGLRVWSSTLRRARETAGAIDAPTTPWRALDEIDAGGFEGMSYAEIRASHPEEHAARTRDKLRYRYPRGESYLDVMRRLEPVIVELERVRRPLLIVAHQAVLRALYTYLRDRPQAELPYVPMPLHTVLRLEPTTYGCAEERIPLLES